MTEIRDVQVAGGIVGDALANDRPVAISYAPGNYTVYRLLFVPMDMAMREVLAPGGGEDERVVVSLTNFGTTYTFRMADVHPSYVEEKLKVSLGDAVPIIALFVAVGERMKDIAAYRERQSTPPEDAAYEAFNEAYQRSFAGRTGLDAEDHDEAVREGIDAAVDVWKKRAENAEAINAANRDILLGGVPLDGR